MPTTCSSWSLSPFSLAFGFSSAGARFGRRVTKISAASSQAKILQAGAVTTIAFEFWDNDVMKLTEEMRQYNASPLSGLVSSYVECAVSNEDGMADDSNDDSFLCGLLGQNFTNLLMRFDAIDTEVQRRIRSCNRGCAGMRCDTVQEDDVPFLA